MAFLCGLIGRMKILAYSARVRVAGRKLKDLVHSYIIRFRQRRQKVSELRLSQFLTAFTSMDKQILAGRLILFKVLRLQRAWRRWLQQKQFMVFINLLKWQNYEIFIRKHFDKARASFDKDTQAKIQHLIYTNYKYIVPPFVKEWYVREYILTVSRVRRAELRHQIKLE